MLTFPGTKAERSMLTGRHVNETKCAVKRKKIKSFNKLLKIVYPMLLYHPK